MASPAVHWARAVVAGAAVAAPGCPRCPAAVAARPTSPHGRRRRRSDWCLGCRRRVEEGAVAKAASGGVGRATVACRLSTWHAWVTRGVVAVAACGMAAGVTGAVVSAAVRRDLLPFLPPFPRQHCRPAASAVPSPPLPWSLATLRKKRAEDAVGTVVAAAAAAAVVAGWRQPPLAAVVVPREPAAAAPAAAACSGGWPSAPSGPAWQLPPAAAACSGSPGAGASRRQP